MKKNRLNDEEYMELLRQAPADHNSPEFKLFLMNNNNITYHDSEWLGVINVKYWTLENNWQTYFYIGGDRDDGAYYAIGRLLKNLKPNMELKIKSEINRSVKLFHFHVYNK